MNITTTISFAVLGGILAVIGLAMLVRRKEYGIIPLGFGAIILGVLVIGFLFQP